MTVLGIDPGVNKLGYGIIEEKNGSFKVLNFEHISPLKKFSFKEKLKYLHSKLEDIFNKYNPDVVAIEEIYLAKNVQIALKIGEVTGMIIGLGLKRGIEFFLIPAREVKKNVVGTGAATKEQVKFMVENLAKVKGIKSFDESDALAVAISYIALKKENDLLY